MLRVNHHAARASHWLRALCRAIASWLLMPAMATMAVGCAINAQDPALFEAGGEVATTGPAPLVADGDSILFVGNSYMGNKGGVYNYLARAMAAADPPLRLVPSSRIFYGQGLQSMCTDRVRRMIINGGFAAVVITSGDGETMRRFDKTIREHGAATVVYMTWSGRHPGNGATIEDYRQWTARSVQVMREMECDTGAVVVPLAVIYYDLTVRPPRDGLRVDYLWEPANIHQNELGTVVNSWALYAVLTGRSPIGIDYDSQPHVVGDRLSENPDIVFDVPLRRALQERVLDVVRQWQSGKTEFDLIETAFDRP